MCRFKRKRDSGSGLSLELCWLKVRELNGHCDETKSCGQGVVRHGCSSNQSQSKERCGAISNR